MGYITYKQADSRWGKKNYNGSSNMATAGCGPTSCAMIAFGVDGKTTPLETMKYMQSHGYAIRNNGTAWNGIPNCLKAFGVKDVKEVVKMADVFALMAKGYVGVFLFRSGSRGGITWTSSGHYIAVTDYKVVGGKHYIYTRDSGGRNHTGWYCYETQMKGLIPKIWLGYVEPPQPVAKPTGKYTGTIPVPTIKNGSTGENVKALQNFLNWYHAEWKLTVDGKDGSSTTNALATFQLTEGITVDGVYGKGSQAKAENYKTVPTPEPPKPVEPTKTGYTGAFPTLNSVQATINFAKAQKGTYAWRGKSHKKFSNKFTKFFSGRYGIDASGQFPKYKSDIAGDCDLFAFGYCLDNTGVSQRAIMDAMGTTWWWWSANLYRHIKKIGKVTKTPKAGAIGFYGGSNGICTHICLITGTSGGKIQSIDKIENKVKACSRSKSAYLGFYMPTYRAYLMKGDTGEDVKLLQNFLNWYGGYNLKTDGDFGKLTDAAVRDYQTKEGLTVDCKFGNASLTKAKTIKR